MSEAHPERWYHRFFSPEFWLIADAEYDSLRTAAEVEYLRTVIGPSRGRRVLDLGCGAGRHAIPLAVDEWTVTGVDVSPSTLARARDNARAAGVAVDFRQVDLMRRWARPFGPVHAAYCIQSFGWGSDWDQLSFLRRIHRELDSDGVLVLDFSNPVWIHRHFEGEASAEVGGVTFRFHRVFDIKSSRMRGSIVVEIPDRPPVSLEHDFRLYTVSEIAELLAQTGYRVESIDADFVAGSVPTHDTRYSQAVARPLPKPPRSLAVGAYRTIMPSISSEQMLDLRNSPDECEFLTVTPWALALSRGESPRERWDAITTYAVYDPYGAEGLADAVAGAFGMDLMASQVHAGAGVSGLLYSLSGLARRGRVLVLPHAHPDFPIWCASSGAEVMTAPGDTAGDLIETTTSQPTDIVYLDRPSVLGDCADADEIVALAECLQPGVLIVDESNANYLGPARSILALTASLTNLIVLRGMSKGYRAGGLRLGFAVCSAAVCADVAEVMPPLAATPTSISAAQRLLAAGDIFPDLRARIKWVKPQMVEWFHAAGMPAQPGHPELPWVTLPDKPGVLQRLESARILGKQIRSWASASSHGQRMTRLSTPLADRRVAALRQLLGVSGWPGGRAQSGRAAGAARHPR
jgi:histidinol-phosphate/aromatic aminotransferase/cobyric acid decarboxylase-like protein/SAM-dependent methyltransferase